MLLGIGTDLVKVSRIAKTYERFGNRFVSRILSPREITEYNNYTRDKIQFLASRYGYETCSYIDGLLRRQPTKHSILQESLLSVLKFYQSRVGFEALSVSNSQERQEKLSKRNILV